MVFTEKWTFEVQSLEFMVLQHLFMPIASRLVESFSVEVRHFSAYTSQQHTSRLDTIRNNSVKMSKLWAKQSFIFMTIDCSAIIYRVRIKQQKQHKKNCLICVSHFRTKIESKHMKTKWIEISLQAIEFRLYECGVTHSSRIERDVKQKYVFTSARIGTVANWRRLKCDWLQSTWIMTSDLWFFFLVLSIISLTIDDDTNYTKRLSLQSIHTKITRSMEDEWKRAIQIGTLCTTNRINKTCTLEWNQANRNPKTIHSKAFVANWVCVCVSTCVKSLRECLPTQ